MTGLWLAIGFVVWYSLSLVVSEQFAGKSRLGKQWLFFISFIFSPLLGICVVYLTKKS
jgi:hypothetical protein